MAINIPRLYPVPYTWVEPPHVTIPHEVMLDLVRWFTTRVLQITPGVAAVAVAGVLSQGERMNLDWFHLQEEPYLALQVAAPQLSGIKRDIHSLRILLTVLIEQSLATRARKEAASGQIFAGMIDITPVLLQYYGEGNQRPDDSVLYDDLLNWVHLALQGVIFLEKKIVNGMALTAAYDAFRVLTDPMNNLSHEMDLGIKSLEECREAAVIAHRGREVLEQCFIAYFQDYGELSNEAAKENIHLIREYVPEIRFDPEFNIEIVKGYQRAGTLHQRCTVLRPVFLQQ